MLSLKGWNFTFPKWTLGKQSLIVTFIRSSGLKSSLFLIASELCASYWSIYDNHRIKSSKEAEKVQYENLEPTKVYQQCKLKVQLKLLLPSYICSFVFIKFPETVFEWKLLLTLYFTDTTQFRIGFVIFPPEIFLRISETWRQNSFQVTLCII